MPSWKSVLTIAIVAVVAVELYTRFVRPKIFA